MDNEVVKDFIEQYAKRVCLGSYVPCEICGALHDDGGLIEYRGKVVYACLDCIDRLNK